MQHKKCNFFEFFSWEAFLFMAKVLGESPLQRGSQLMESRAGKHFSKVEKLNEDAEEGM